MTLADIHRKLEGLNLTSRSEDLLTSNVFGCLRYLPPAKALVPFIRTALSLEKKPIDIPEEIIKAYATFWPFLRATGHSNCEPDVVLGLETADDHLYVVMIEAKYLSGPSSEADEKDLPHHQLARELDQLSVIDATAFGWETCAKPSACFLVYVTRDNTMPTEDIKEGLSEYCKKSKKTAEVYWTSWSKLPSILETCLTTELISEHRLIMQDMLVLLKQKWLITFNGVDSIKTLYPIPDFYPHLMKEYKWPSIKIAPIFNFSPPPNKYSWPTLESQGPIYQYLGGILK